MSATSSCLSLLQLDHPASCSTDPTSPATLQFVINLCLEEKGLVLPDPRDLKAALNTLGFPLEILQPNLDEAQDRLWVLDHLLTDIMQTRMAEKTSMSSSTRPESRIRDALQLLQCSTFNPEFIQKAKKLPFHPDSEPLFQASLDARTWDRVESFSDKMSHEFQTRRNLLLTRLNATVNSFLWSESGQRHQAQIQRYLLAPELSRWDFRAKTPADLLAAGAELTVVAKVSGQAPRARTHGLTKVKIGRVPDRGGRAFEQAAPAPEMPPWQKRQQPEGGHDRGGRGGGFRGNRGRGGGGGGGGRHRGGKSRVQGAGWNR